MSDKYYLSLLAKYSKKNAKKENKFANFSPNEDLLSINYESFAVSAMASVFVASLKKDFKKAKKSDAEFIYYAKSGRLFFNENGSGKGFGKGGVVALFQKSASLIPPLLFSDEGPPPPEPVMPAPPTAPTDGLLPMGRGLRNCRAGCPGRSAWVGKLTAFRSPIRLGMS